MRSRSSGITDQRIVTGASVSSVSQARNGVSKMFDGQASQSCRRIGLALSTVTILMMVRIWFVRIQSRPLGGERQAIPCVPTDVDILAPNRLVLAGSPIGSDHELEPSRSGEEQSARFADV